uniref:Collagen type IV alpha-3-binding protein n=1 Tax=Rhabditophanes sp. KR3021 TaxID=114890 RepID=A0AC35TJ37_9BILA
MASVNGKMVCTEGMNSLSILPIEGTLIKWTNYLSGWQERYFKVHDGALYYYKSKDDVKFGCRKSMSLANSLIRPDGYEETNFELALNGEVWFLRAQDEMERNWWVRSLNDHAIKGLADSGKAGLQNNKLLPDNVNVNYSFETTSTKEQLERLTAHESNVSLNFSKLQDHIENLVEIVLKSSEVKDQAPFARQISGELANFRESLRLLSDMVSQFAESGNVNGNNTNIAQNKCEKTPIDKSENCVDNVGQDNEIGLRSISPPTSCLSDTEDEFYDTCASPDSAETPNHSQSHIFQEQKMSKSIRTDVRDVELWNAIDKTTLEQLSYAKEPVVEKGPWELFSQKGAMKMYKMEVEIDGHICDPLKALHYIEGITAKEYLHYFYEFKYKTDWDDTLEKSMLVDKIADDICVIHQIHKRIWPSAQRESLFWSHIRDVSASKDDDAYDALIVCNHDVKRGDLPLVNSSSVRVGLKIAMYVQTIILNKDKPLTELTRKDIAIRIVYVAQVDPGGWLPKAPLMQVYKREYPKFLNNFTAYVAKKVASTKVDL